MLDGEGGGGICDVQQHVLIRLKSSTSTLTSNQCRRFFFLQLSECEGGNLRAVAAGDGAED